MSVLQELTVQPREPQAQKSAPGGPSGIVGEPRKGEQKPKPPILGTAAGVKA